MAGCVRYATPYTSLRQVCTRLEKYCQQNMTVRHAAASGRMPAPQKSEFLPQLLWQRARHREAMKATRVAGCRFLLKVAHRNRSVSFRGWALAIHTLRRFAIGFSSLNCDLDSRWLQESVMNKA